MTPRPLKRPYDEPPDTFPACSHCFEVPVKFVRYIGRHHHLRLTSFNCRCGSKAIYLRPMIDPTKQPLYGRDFNEYVCRLFEGDKLAHRYFYLLPDDFRKHHGV